MGISLRLDECLKYWLHSEASTIKSIKSFCMCTRSKTFSCVWTDECMNDFSRNEISLNAYKTTAESNCLFLLEVLEMP